MTAPGPEPTSVGATSRTARLTPQAYKAALTGPEARNTTARAQALIRRTVAAVGGPDRIEGEPQERWGSPAVAYVAVSRRPPPAADAPRRFPRPREGLLAVGGDRG